MPASLPTVAVLDDEPRMRKALRRLLDTHGFNVTEFADASAFLMAYSESTAICLILDLQMPGVTGLELLQVMSARGLRLPVIVVTGTDEPDARRRALDFGAAAYLTKPVNETALLDAIHAVSGVH